MARIILFASVGLLIIATAAVAAPRNNGPEPYSAPDPVYMAHHIDSSVKFKDDKPVLPINGSQDRRQSSGDHS